MRVPTYSKICTYIRDYRFILKIIKIIQPYQVDVVTTHIKIILYGSMFSTSPILSWIRWEDIVAYISYKYPVRLLVCQEWDPWFCSHFMFSWLASRRYYLVLPPPPPPGNQGPTCSNVVVSPGGGSPSVFHHIFQDPQGGFFWFYIPRVDRVSLMFHETGLCCLFSTKRYFILYALEGGHIPFMFREADPLYFTYSQRELVPFLEKLAIS